jgi:hypothetical protein
VRRRLVEALGGGRQGARRVDARPRSPAVGRVVVPASCAAQLVLLCGVGGVGVEVVLHDRLLGVMVMGARRHWRRGAAQGPAGGLV